MQAISRSLLLIPSKPTANKPRETGEPALNSLHRYSFAAAVALLAAACTTEVAHSPLTAKQFRNVELRGVYPFRIWGDEAPENIEKLMAARIEQTRERYADREGGPAQRLLALSGGGVAKQDRTDRVF